MTGNDGESIFKDGKVPKGLFVFDVAEPCPPGLWEIDPLAFKCDDQTVFEHPYRTGPAELVGDDQPVKITWPDGTSTVTACGELRRAGVYVYVTMDGMQEGEVPTQQVTITVTEDPPEPHVVEGR